MKQVIFGIVCGSFVLLTMVLVMTVDGRSIRENELDEALETAVWKVMDNLVATGHYSVADEEEFVADGAYPYPAKAFQKLTIDAISQLIEGVIFWGRDVDDEGGLDAVAWGVFFFQSCFCYVVSRRVVVA